MRIPPYWARAAYTNVDHRGRQKTFECCGWSFSSQADASADAQARARRAFDRFLRGEAIGAYGYLDRPLREQQIEVVQLGDSTAAIITRNAYGALVLNAASVLFVDVDIPHAKPRSIWEAISWVFYPAGETKRFQTAREQTRENIRAWTKPNSGHSLRLYETAAGFRLLFTDRRYDPKESRTQSIFEGLGCDPLYRRLCQQQECFRARLTPKPWRCGSEKPPSRFPWRDAQAEERFGEWERLYAECAVDFAVCRLSECIGPDAEDDEIRAIIDVHDRHACNVSAAALA